MLLFTKYLRETLILGFDRPFRRKITNFKSTCDEAGFPEPAPAARLSDIRR